ncbi:MAG TPA: hypothetical protein ENJ95_10590 [Bacteroidetes bacterium]|nr:hypothetical protein [Bacteroidota bacterium]
MRQSTLLFLFSMIGFFLQPDQAVANGFDLEVGISTSTPDPAIYSDVPITVTATNAGTEAGTGIEIRVGICGTEAFGIVQQNLLVWANTGSSATGNWDWLNQRWTIPNLAPGQTATLTFTLFTLTEEARGIQVFTQAAATPDVDSSPGNLPVSGGLWVCTDTEDDEATLTLNAAAPSCAITASVADITCDDNGTPDDATDDTFGFALMADNPAPSTGYQLFIPELSAAFNGTYGAPLNLSGINISVGSLTLNLTDDVVAGCTGTRDLNPPPPCSNGAGLPDFNLVSFFAVQPVAGGGSAVIEAGDEVAAGTVINVPDHFAWLDFPVPLPVFDVTIKAYLSTDTVVGAGDVPILSGSREMNASVQNFGFSEGSIGTGPIPASTPPGNYFIILKYDADDLVAESDEANNSLSVPIVLTSGGTGGIDLELSLAQPNTAPVIYSNYEVVATLTNTGSETATGVQVSFAKPVGVVYTGGNEYDASQGSFNPNGDEIWTVGSIPAGASATMTVSYFLLQNGAPNAYAQVSAANETDSDSTPGNGTPPTPNEDDEAATGDSPPPVLTADLLLTNLNITNAPIEPGAVLTYNFDILNIGNGPADGNFNVKAWISTSPFLTGTSIQDGIVPTGNFPAGFSVSGVPGASTLPPVLADGQYYLLLKVDADDVIAESNENNNWLNLPFLVQAMPQPGDCDGLIGAGFVNCTSQDGSGQLEVVYQSGDDLNVAVLDGTGQVVSDNFFGAVPPDFNYSVSGDQLKKTSGGTLVYSLTIPPALFAQYDAFLNFTEFNSGFILFGYEESTSSVYGILADGNLGVLHTALLAVNVNSPGTLWPPRLNSPLQVSANEVAFFLTANVGQPTVERIELYVINGNLGVTSTETISQNIFAAGATLKPNPCGSFSMNIIRQLSFCVHGACFDNESREGVFENGAFATLSSYRVSEFSTMGIGSRSQTWQLRTDDGGLITGTQTQQLPINPNPPNNVIHLEKTLSGTMVWEKDVAVASASSVRRLAMSAGELVFLSEKINAVFVESLSCLEDNTPPPSDGVDLELSMGTANANPAIYTSTPLVLTVENTGTEPASGIVIEWKRPSGTVYTGGNEWTATQGSFNPFGNEQWTVGSIPAGGSASITVSYFLLSENALTAYAQVLSANETDGDSTPGNGTPPTPNEDDEAALTLNAFAGGGGVALQARELIGRPVQLRAVNPNPVYHGTVSVVIDSREAGSYGLECYDLFGRLAFSKKINLEEGRNEVPLNVSRLESGTYYLNMPGENWRGMPIRFVVARW